MIAVVVPTIRPEQFATFKEKWQHLFDKHEVRLVAVHDGDKPYVEFRGKKFSVENIMGKEYAEVIYNRTDAVRNLGFAFVAKCLPEVEYIVSLDDDVVPVGDTIKQHIDVLESRASIHWLNTVNGFYVRGVPYNTRAEAPVMLSHGVWTGVPDVDAPTQLIKHYPPRYSWYEGAVPKGALFPLCAMNFAFHRNALPYVYQAPMGFDGFDRFADIWAGIMLKRDFDDLEWAVVTGKAVVDHTRASNVFKNLQKEAKGIELNEEFWHGNENHPYFTLYTQRRATWKEFIASL